MNVHKITVTIAEEERQMLLLALAKLSLDRPGWHWGLGELAAKFSTAPNVEDGRAMFEAFRRLNSDQPPAAQDLEAR